MIDKTYIDKFVTAKLLNDRGTGQGWVTSILKDQFCESGTPLFIIKGQSGGDYVCEGSPVIVINPPKQETSLRPYGDYYDRFK